MVNVHILHGPGARAHVRCVYYYIPHPPIPHPPYIPPHPPYTPSHRLGFIGSSHFVYFEIAMFLLGDL